MRAVIQRVSSARVRVDGRVIGEIGRGLLVFVGVAGTDGPADLDYIAGKIRDLRVFGDEQGRMNLSVGDVGGAVLVVSQFTLYGDCRKGRRPSFDRAAPPSTARPLYDVLLDRLRADGLDVQAGEFQAMMQVELVNDGPVTLLVDSGRGALMGGDRRGDAAPPEHTAGSIARGRLLALALAGEGLLALVALAWIVGRRLPVRWGEPGRGVAAGLALAAGLAAVNYLLLIHAPDVPGVRSLRALSRHLLRPLFADARPGDVLVISAAAGLGEELFFRGAVQHEFGLVAAGVLFGAMHVGGAGTVVFGVWAGIIGLALGALATAAGGLLAPIVAHAVYDAAALAFIRWGSVTR